MTRTEMLQRIDLTEEEFKHLILKFRVFYACLTPQEQRLVNRTLPKAEQVLRVFGPEVDVRDLQLLLSADSSGGTFGQNGINQIVNPGGSGDLGAADNR